VREVVAATAATHAVLWRYLADIDLSVSVEAEVPTDDALVWLVDDPRAITTTNVRDFLFVRVLDTCAVLSARSWRVPVDVVIDVDDPFRPQGRAAGRFHLRGGPDGAECTPTTAPADVSMGVDSLGSLVLGGGDATAMAAAGRITGHHPGAVAQLALAFGWVSAPFCATRF
jgi:predicted acetyltransferase